jgi:hypothetical protein
MMIYFLQLSAPTAAETLDAYKTLQTAVQSRMDGLWNTHFFNTTSATGGGIFGVICNAMLGFALLALVFTLISELYKNSKNLNINLIEKIIVPVLVITLLLGEGNFLKVLIGGIRGAANVTNENVLTLMQSTASVNAGLAGLTGDGDKISELLASAKACNSGPSVDKATCLAAVKTNIDTAVSSGQISSPSAISKLTDLSNKVGSALGSGDLLKAADLFVGGLNKLNPINNALMSFFNYLMAGVSAAIQILLEEAALLTALIAPIYVTWSILPSGSKAIVSWLSTFWSIFLFKLCYSIVVGFSASFYDIDGINALYMGIVSSFLAPLLAGILAAGGGMGFYNAAISLAAKAVDVGIGIASGGASAAAGSAVSISRAAK